MAYFHRSGDVFHLHHLQRGDFEFAEGFAFLHAVHKVFTVVHQRLEQGGELLSQLLFFFIVRLGIIAFFHLCEIVTCHQCFGLKVSELRDRLTMVLPVCQEKLLAFQSHQVGCCGELIALGRKIAMSPPNNANTLPKIGSIQAWNLTPGSRTHSSGLPGI